MAQSVCFKDHTKCLNCFNLKEAELKAKALDYAIFARVNPDQKIWLVEALKERGHVVGMVGDGVNDVMALKEADFSIALGSACDSAKNIANVVLLDDDFNHMNSIVKEGRRVINNIQRTAALFLTKTILSIGLALLTITILKEYPFLPIQLTLLSSLLIGMPAFLLSLEPNYDLVKGDFLANVLGKALPFALGIILASLFLELLANLGLIDSDLLSTMTTLTCAFIMLGNICSVALPFNLFRGIVFLLSCLGLMFAFSFLRDIFYLEMITFFEMIICLLTAGLTLVLIYFLHRLKLLKKVIARIDELY